MSGGYGVLGWGLLLLAFSLVVLFMLLILYRHRRRTLLNSIRYLLDRLQVAELDLCREREDLLVLKEYLRRRGFLDDEDLGLLRRELIDIPRQKEAEKNELLREALKRGDRERIVKDTPDTVH